MFPYKQVMLLQVFLKFDIDYSDREINAIKRAIGKSSKPCMHNSRHIGFVLTTNETPQELVNRLRDVLEVDNITDYTAVNVLGKPAGKHGGLNSFVTHVGVHFAALEAGPAKYLRETQTVIVPNFRQRAPREMSIERRRDR
jgi:hypothetical protein